MSTEGNDVNEWLDSFSQQQIQIWCEDPESNVEKIAGGVLGVGKTYVTYRILMKQVGRDIVGVRHRYSEFEALRNSMRDRYGPMGVAVPSLPPKTSLSNIVSANLKQTFIKERIAGLTIFCELIVASPWLRNDKLWKEFMKPRAAGSAPNTPSESQSSMGSFASAFRGGSSSPVPVVYDSDNVGENKLIACLSQLAVPYKFTLTQRMEEVRIEVAMIEKFAKIALEKVRVVQTCERACASAQEGMLDALNSWVTAEQAGVRTMAGKTFDENQNVLQFPHEHAMHSVSSATTMLRTKCGLAQSFPDYTGLGLATMLEQELAMAESVKELLRMHDEMVSGIDAITAKIVKTEASRSANKFEQAAEQRIILEERQASLTAFYKGFIYFTLPCCARQRAASLRRLSSVVVASDLTSAYALQVACVKFFADINARPAAAIAESNRMFELLGVKQLELIPEDTAATMASPAASSSPVASVSDRTAGLTLGDSATRGAVCLSAESTGITGLFQRAQLIGSSAKAAVEPTRRIIGGAAPSAPVASAEGANNGNPLARRGSAVMKQQQEQQAQLQRQDSSSPRTGGAAASSEGSSLMAEVPDELLSDYNIRPSEDQPLPAPPARSGPAASGRLSPLKPSEKSQSLMADLMGGGASADGGKKVSVWEDV